MYSHIYLFISFILTTWTMLKGELFRKPYWLLIFLAYEIVIYLILFAIHVIFFAIIGLAIDKDNPQKRPNYIFKKVGFDTLKVFLDTMRIRVHVEGVEKIPKDGFLIVSNHLSCFDPMIYLLLFKDYNLAFVSKKENMKIPFVGRYMAAIGCVPLDREDTKSAIKSINTAADYVKQGQGNMGIYPEGWVNKSDKPLLPFRNGAFQIAKKADVSILVTTIGGSEKIKKQFLFRPTHVYVDILDVIPESEVKHMRTAEIGERVQNIMYNNLVAHGFRSDEA